MKSAIRFSLLFMALSAPAHAVQPQHWRHTTEADFKSGTFHNVVATNLGDLKLSRAVKTLVKPDARVSAVYALASGDDGAILAATGPEGVLLRIKDEQVSTYASLGDNLNLLCLQRDAQGRLLVGTGGERGRVLRIDKAEAEPVELFSAEGVQYVWAMCQTADGVLYLATGPTGQLHELTPDGKHRVLFDSEEANLLSLVSDGKETLYVGSDPGGLVYRINRKSGDAFVLYDAEETEISALALDAAGNLYAATAQSTSTEAGGAAAATEPAGRPEADATLVPLPAQEPPREPPPPEPPPTEPEPEPKGTPTPRASLDAGHTAGGFHPVFLAQELPADSPATAPGAPSVESPKPELPPALANDEPAPNGNAIYRIDPQGFVSEVFRAPVMVYSLLAEQGGTILAGTGGEGELYQINPAAEETLVLAKVDSREILLLMATTDGRVLLGLSNAGDVAAMTPGFAQNGTFTSAVLDAQQVSRFGKLQLEASLPPGTRLSVATRSGNVKQSSAPGWSEWSPETPAARQIQVSSPAARFLQYRLTLAGENGQSPVVDEVGVAYQTPNLPPRLTTLKVVPGEGAEGAESPPDARAQFAISWEATDPNEDALRYDLYCRLGTQGPWIVLKRALTDPAYTWDTRTAGQGRYQVKVEASDAAANPLGEGKTGTRISDPFVIDNVAPVIRDLLVTPEPGQATVTLKVADQLSNLRSLEYTVDSGEQWQAVLPSDIINDSPEEAYRFVVPGLSVGAHQLTVRASDGPGNRAFESVLVKINAAPAK